MRRVVPVVTLVLLSVAVLGAAGVTTVRADDTLMWAGDVYSSGNPLSSPTLEAGRLYRIEVREIWGPYGYASPTGLYADAQYYTTDTGLPPWEWRNSIPAPNGHSFVQINGMDVNWGPFSNGIWVSGVPKGHTYTIYYVGQGAPIAFTIVDWMDGKYGNNWCHLPVSIYEVSSGNIVVEKVTDPSSDTTTSFSFSSSGPNGFSQSFSLAGGQSHDSGWVLPGSGYSVSENVPSGWVLTSGTCDNGNDPSSITVGAGQTVTCTFPDKKLTVPMETSFSDTNGNPLPIDADGQPMVQIVAPGGKVRSTNPGAVVAIVDVTNPGTVFSSVFQFSDTLPRDWTLLPEWKGKSSGNVKVCFYHASAFPLTGFPFSPNWTFKCTGGVDITNQVSYAGTSSTVVSVNVPGSVLSALGGFGPGDHITVSMKMKFNPLKGSSLPTSYFSDGPNSAGVSFKAFTNSATASIDSFTVSNTGTFGGYPKNN